MPDTKDNPDGTVTISEADYARLCENRRMLDELNNAGVDNWEGYECVNWGYVRDGVRS